MLKKTKQLQHDIHRIITEKKCISLFQPIVSIAKNTIIGFEGLARGLGRTGEIISPLYMFELAENAGVTMELDALCRETALASFYSTYKKHTDLLLFINVDSSNLNYLAGSSHIINAARQLGYHPQNIVIELNENRIIDMERFEIVCAMYREHGFLIALDDVGSGFSNLDRILMLRPDIIKIDKSLVCNLHKEFYKQEVFKSVINLSKKIGSLVVAEGVEHIEEALASVEMGADMLQGYYFSKPETINSEGQQKVTEKIEHTANQFKEFIHNKTKKEKIHQTHYDSLLEHIIRHLYDAKHEALDANLRNIIKVHSEIECIYVLDTYGTQISNTVCRPSLMTKKSPIFQPAEKGQDHSLKKYYYFLMDMGLSKYLTSSYISLATGNICVTLSAKYLNALNEEYILCIDFNCT